MDLDVSDEGKTLTVYSPYFDMAITFDVEFPNVIKIKTCAISPPATFNMEQINIIRDFLASHLDFPNPKPTNLNKKVIEAVGNK